MYQDLFFFYFVKFFELRIILIIITVFIIITCVACKVQASLIQQYQRGPQTARISSHVGHLVACSVRVFILRDC